MIKSLKLKGFYLNENMCSRLNSVYYDCENDEDCWIEIIPDHNLKNAYIVLYVKNAETVCAESFSAFTGKEYEDAENFSNWISKNIEELQLLS